MAPSQDPHSTYAGEAKPANGTLPPAVRKDVNRAELDRYYRIASGTSSTYTDIERVAQEAARAMAEPVSRYDIDGQKRIAVERQYFEQASRRAEQMLAGFLEREQVATAKPAPSTEAAQMKPVPQSLPFASSKADMNR